MPPQPENHEGGLLFLKLSKKKKKALRRRVEGKFPGCLLGEILFLLSLCFVWLFLFCFSLGEIKVLWWWLKISAEKRTLTLVWKLTSGQELVFSIYLSIGKGNAGITQPCPTNSNPSLHQLHKYLFYAHCLLVSGMPGQ